MLYLLLQAVNTDHVGIEFNFYNLLLTCHSNPHFKSLSQIAHTSQCR
jgi:hypothetical protein